MRVPTLLSLLRRGQDERFRAGRDTPVRSLVAIFVSVARWRPKPSGGKLQVVAVLAGQFSLGCLFWFLWFLFDWSSIKLAKKEKIIRKQLGYVSRPKHPLRPP